MSTTELDHNGLVSDLAEALVQLRSMLPLPARRGARAEKPLFKVPPASLGYLRAVDLALRSSLHRLGENPGETMMEADAIKLRMMGLGARACAAAPRPEQDEAVRRIAELEAQLAEARHDLEIARGNARDLRRQFDALRQQPAALPQPVADDAPTVDDLLEQAGEASGSDDPWRELGRFAEFCARITFAGDMESDLVPSGVIPAVIPDDPDLPVAPWVRAEERQPPATILEAAELYLAWTKLVTAKWREQRGLPSTA